MENIYFVKGFFIIFHQLIKMSYAIPAKMPRKESLSFLSIVYIYTMSK